MQKMGLGPDWFTLLYIELVWIYFFFTNVVATRFTVFPHTHEKKKKKTPMMYCFLVGASFFFFFFGVGKGRIRYPQGLPLVSLSPLSPTTQHT